MQTDAKSFDRALQAVLLSQYRRKIFEKNKLLIKPVILFKSKTINESKIFEEVPKQCPTLASIGTPKVAGLPELLPELQEV